MIAGAALVLLALSLFLWNQYADWRAGKSAEQVVAQLKEAIAQESDGDVQDPYAEEMSTFEIGGYAYIGYLSIPSLQLELPVMAGWDYARLRIAPCRYAGSAKTDDLVVAAHNYRRHFGLIRTMSPSDVVTFTDADGIVSTYTVVTVDTLAAVAVEDMTSGEYDLTLFTCTYSGQSRVAVRCMKQD